MIKTEYLPPLDPEEDDALQFLKQNRKHWNAWVNELRELMDSIRKKEVSIHVITPNKKK